jgi:hypothetical protein
MKNKRTALSVSICLLLLLFCIKGFSQKPIIENPKPVNIFDSTNKKLGSAALTAASGNGVDETSSLPKVDRQAEYDFEEILLYRIEQVAYFYEIDEWDSVKKDILYFSEPGFIINSSWQEVKIGCDTYVIITSPEIPLGEKSTQSTSNPNGNPKTRRLPITGSDSVKRFCMLKSDFEKLNMTAQRKKQAKIIFGVLSLPLKIRPINGLSRFQMSTDLTVGPYLGVTMRLSKSKWSRIYGTIPVSLGLTLVNIFTNEIGVSGSPDPKLGVVPGVSFASGIILQWVDRKTSVGLIGGWDFASGDGSWAYNGKFWYSLGISYSFLRK